MGDAITSLVDLFKERAKSRFWPTFAFVFILHNWKFFYIILAIPYDNSIYCNSLRMLELYHSNFVNFYITPILYAILLNIFIPYLDAFLGYIQIKATVLNKTAHHETETRVAEKKADLLTREQDALLKSERITSVIKYLRDDYTPLTIEERTKLISIKKQYEPYKATFDDILSKVYSYQISQSNFEALKKIASEDSDHLLRPLLIQKHKNFILSVRLFVDRTDNTENNIADNGLIKLYEHHPLHGDALPFQLFLAVIGNYESFMNHLTILIEREN